MNLASIGSLAPPPAATAVARSGGAGDFRVGLQGAIDAGAASAASSKAASVTRAAPIGMALMLGLQESTTAEAGDREARRQANGVLAALAELQRALLGSNSHGNDALQRLSVLTEALPQPTDPVLARAIGAIRLRARVELARVQAAQERGTPRS